MAKYLQKKYYDAQRLGFLHLKKFPDVNSSPAVTYYMGKIAFKLKHYESSNNYYKQVIAKYPDSYYAFRANYNLYKDCLLYTSLWLVSILNFFLNHSPNFVSHKVLSCLIIHSAALGLGHSLDEGFR